MATKVDNNERTISDLDQQIAELQAQRKKIIALEREKDLELIRNLMHRHEFSEEELGFGKQRKESRNKLSKANLPAKYFDPTGNGKAWNGKGRKPKWIEGYLSANANSKLEDLLAPKSK